jgi:hypothetical protein
LSEEASSYRKSSQIIDAMNRNLEIRFENLETAAATKVFQLSRPQSVTQKSKIQSHSTTQPQTSRFPHSARPQHPVRNSPHLWITTNDIIHSNPTHTIEDFFDSSSHHFLTNLPLHLTDRPKTARHSKAPLSVRRIQGRIEKLD